MIFLSLYIYFFRISMIKTNTLLKVCLFLRSKNVFENCFGFKLIFFIILDHFDSSISKIDKKYLNGR
jgi:type III secretory pathway component EscR